MNESRRLVLVEDHELTRLGLRTALEQSGDLTVVAEAADGEAGLAAVLVHRPDAAVVDLGLPGMDGIELTRRIRERAPGVRVVILTMNDLETEVLASLAAGADGYCVKSSNTEGIVAAVRAVATGGAYFDAHVAGIVLRDIGRPRTATSPSPLTPRETDVLRLIAEGRGNVEIGKALFIGLGTVKGHVRDILEKLAAADRTQAAVTALRRGLI